jgi:UPF0716 family protein affecting phage T7 exclusion
MVYYGGIIGIVGYVDAVLNHKFGADRTERFRATEVDPNDRTRDITDKYDIEVRGSPKLPPLRLTNGKCFLRGGLPLISPGVTISTVNLSGLLIILRFVRKAHGCFTSDANFIRVSTITTMGARMQFSESMETGRTGPKE